MNWIEYYVYKAMYSLHLQHSLVSPVVASTTARVALLLLS